MKVIILDRNKSNKKEIEMESDQNTSFELKNKIEEALGFKFTKDFIYNSKKIPFDDSTLSQIGIKDGSKLIYLGSFNEKSNKKEEENIIKSKSKNEEEKEPDYSNQVNNLIQLGYDKEKAEEVIKKSSGDIKMAIDILLKENSDKQIDRSTEEIDGLPRELRKIGVFMKILTLKEPNRMNIILNNLKINNLPLLQKIKENDNEFIEFLKKPITQEEVNIYIKYYQEANELLGKKNQDLNEGKIEILLTEKENEIINRLKKLGNFSIEDVIEAYIASDKNEKDAENYLHKTNNNYNDLVGNLQK